MKKFKIGQIVRSMVTGEIGEVKAITDDKVFIQVEDNEIVFPNNPACFHVMHDVPEAVPNNDYWIKNGILFKDSDPVTEQGDLYLLSVLAAMYGKLILSAKSRKSDTEVDLFAYDLETDGFEKLISRSAIPEPYVLKEEGHRVILGYNKRHEAQAEDGEKQEIFDRSAIMFVTIENGKAKLDAKFLPEPVCWDYSMDIDNVILLCSNSKVDDNGVVSHEDIHYLIIEGLDGEIKRLNTKNRITWAIQPKLNDSCPLFIKTDEALFYGDVVIRKPDVVSKVKGYNFLVDFKRDGDVIRMVLANYEYDTKTVVSKKTRDRGLIVTVE